MSLADHDVLMMQASFERVADRLARLGARVAVLTEGGELCMGGIRLAETAARPAAAWLDLEVWRSPARDAFLRLMLDAPALAWVQTATAGADAPIYRRLLDKGVALTTSHGQAVGIADYVLWAVLDHFQRGPERRHAQAERRWEVLPFREVSQSRWLVIGFGAIGQAIASRVRAFGARVAAVRRSNAPHPLADEIVAAPDLETALPAADVVVICAPLDAMTRGLVGARFVAAMRPGAVLINVARGGLVDEAALLAGLDRGAPGHAVLDVFAEEPLPAASPLWAHPRVGVSAHTSWASQRLSERNDAEFLENLRRFSRGEPLLHRVAAAGR